MRLQLHVLQLGSRVPARARAQPHLQRFQRFYNFLNSTGRWESIVQTSSPWVAFIIQSITVESVLNIMRFPSAQWLPQHYLRTRYSAHINNFRHGRRILKSSIPKCLPVLMCQHPQSIPSNEYFILKLLDAQSSSQSDMVIRLSQSSPREYSQKKLLFVYVKVRELKNFLSINCITPQQQI